MRTYKEIEKIISDEFNDSLISSPVDLKKIAKHKKIKIKIEELEDSMSGFLVIKGKKRTIVANGNHHLNRRRFTIAHELGHFILHAKDSEESIFIDKKQVYNRNLKSAEGTNAQEIEANRFAACLLMPRTIIMNYIKNEGEFFYEFSDDESSITSLSKIFNVSKMAMTHRLSSLLISS